jgi:hypothetical protein
MKVIMKFGEKSKKVKMSEPGKAASPDVQGEEQISYPDDFLSPVGIIDKGLPPPNSPKYYKEYLTPVKYGKEPGGKIKSQKYALPGDHSINLTSQEEKKAALIESYYSQAKLPLKYRIPGDLFLKCEKILKVDWLILLAIYLNDKLYEQNNIIENALVEDAENFVKLRKKGGADENAPVLKQLHRANAAGFRENENWHKDVFRCYERIYSSIAINKTNR